MASTPEQPIQEDAIAALLDRRSEMWSAFQPILSLKDHRILGYEALLRLPPGSACLGPGEAFDAAAGTDRLVDLEIAALDTHLRASRELRDGRLFVNLSAPAFLDARMQAQILASRARAAGLAPERIVLELTELVRLPDPVHFAAALRPLREEGFLLAVDDFGAGFSNVRILVELGPDFVKIDRSLISGAAEHPRKRVFLESMGALGRRINCAMIGEGVETPEDLATVSACGIPYAQGWGIVRPAPLSFFMAGLRPLPVCAETPLPTEEPVGAFAVPQEGISPSTKVGEVIRLFERRGEPAAVPVLEGCRAQGLFTHNLLFSHLGHRYGFSLWHDRPAGEFVATLGSGYDRLPASALLEEAAELVRRRPAGRRFDPIVIETERGDYHGLLPVDLLLSEMTRLKVEYALQSNPLTGLPGSAALARIAESRIAGERPFVLGWVDIDDFKPFNDRYGFSRGDEVLRLLAETLKRHVSRQGDFLAHLGGDDFAFLAEPFEVEQRLRSAVAEFAEEIPRLYDDSDSVQGGITSFDRQGNERRYGFLVVSVGLVPWRGELGIDYRRLVELAAEVKNLAKKTPGPSVVVNARSLAPAALPLIP
jgi:diguanylate cyclase (GGDEF)-like protein